MMFEHLSDPNPPTPGPEQRAAVGARATRIRRQARIVQSVLAVTAAALLLGGVLALNHRSGTESIDVVNPAGDCCGSLEGTVNGDQAGLKGVTVSLMYAQPAAGAPSTDAAGRPDPRNPWRIKREQLTDATGHYRFDDLEPGTYVLRFRDHFDLGNNKFLYQPTFFGGASVFSKATPVQVATNETRTVDVTLRRSANWGIKGKVQIAGGRTPLTIANITVRLFVDGELTREVLTNKDGNYDLGGVDQGTYTIAFVDVKKGIYATSWGNDGKPITVGAEHDEIVDGAMVTCPGPDASAPLEGCQ
jgi:hypothetical protein